MLNEERQIELQELIEEQQAQMQRTNERIVKIQKEKSGKLDEERQKEFDGLLAERNACINEIADLRDQIAVLNAKTDEEIYEEARRPPNHPKPGPTREEVRAAVSSSAALALGTSAGAVPVPSSHEPTAISKIFKDYKIENPSPEQTIVTKDTTKIEFTKDQVKVTNASPKTYADIAAYAKELVGDDALITIHNASNLEVMVKAFKEAGVKFQAGNEAVKTALAALEARPTAATLPVIPTASPAAPASGAPIPITSPTIASAAIPAPITAHAAALDGKEGDKSSKSESSMGHEEEKDDDEVSESDFGSSYSGSSFGR
ncbi:MAG: hypothetical protein AB7F64_06360 [Gammaproteobacteria bacterium]